MNRSGRLLASMFAVLAPCSCGGEPSGVHDAHDAPGAPVEPSMLVAQRKFVSDATLAFGAHDAKKLGALYAKNAIIVSPGLPNASAQTNAQRWFDAFPDAKVGASRAWSKDNVLVTEWTLRGTESGSFLGFPATNKPIGFPFLLIGWFDDDGLVREEHDYWDPVTVLQQTGALSGPARAIFPLPSSLVWHRATNGAEERAVIELVTRGYEAFASRRTADYLALIADDAEFDDTTMPAAVRGKAFIQESFEQTVKLFPDVRIRPTKEWGIESFAIIEEEIHGGQNRAIGPLPSANSPYTVHEAKIIEMANGKIAKRTVYGNTLELLTQIGAAPDPPRRGTSADDHALP